MRLALALILMAAMVAAAIIWALTTNLVLFMVATAGFIAAALSLAGLGLTAGERA